MGARRADRDAARASGLAGRARAPARASRSRLAASADRAGARERGRRGLQLVLRVLELRELLPILRRASARVEVRAQRSRVQVAREQDEQHRAQAARAAAADARAGAAATVGHTEAFRRRLCGLLPAAHCGRARRQRPRRRGAPARSRPSSLARVASRCPHGRPAVLLQAPYDEAGVPFPTLYWLSCPALVQSVGRLEARGRHRAAAARARRAIPRSQPTATRSSARVRAARRRLAPTRRRCATAARRSRRASRARRRRAGSSACTRTRRPRSPTLPTGSARGCSSSPTRRYPDTCCLA